METYPWHEHNWQQWLQRYSAGKLPHALLLSGPAGVGKVDFAKRFAQLMLCSAFQDSSGATPTEPCGVCQSCGLINAGTHPDLLVVEPEAEGKTINVERVREVAEFLSLTSQYGSHQVVIIAPAEKMNRFAANSLLKTLEEPTGGSYLLLVSHQPSLLLPTVRSRCQRLSFELPSLLDSQAWLRRHLPQASDAQARQLLQLAGGAPLPARNYGQNNVLELYAGLLQSFVQLASGRADPISVAKIWSQTDVPLLLRWLIQWTAHIIRLKSYSSLPDSIEAALGAELQNCAAQVDLRDIFRFSDQLLQSYRLLDSQVNVQLLLEDVAITWLRMNQKSAQRKSA